MSTATLRPCPFCRSSNLRQLEITIAHDDRDEGVDAIECLDCDSQARVEWWNGKTLELMLKDAAGALAGSG